MRRCKLDHMARCFWANALTCAITTICGCAGVGPSALSHGRSAYNTVINATEDQQILSMIVHHRYDDTFGMLAVSNVTASLKFRGTLGGNVGIGPESSFEG